MIALGFCSSGRRLSLLRIVPFLPMNSAVCRSADSTLADDGLNLLVLVEAQSALPVIVCSTSVMKRVSAGVHTDWLWVPPGHDTSLALIASISLT
jgi:hypothetical protein